MYRITLLALAVTAAIGLSVSARAADGAATPRSEVNLSHFDANTKACENFYQHANGGWMSKNPVPADQTSWGSFNVLAERGTDDLRTILEDAVKNQGRSHNDAMVGILYASSMDEAKINAFAAKPLRTHFKEIAAVKKPADLQKFINTTAARGDYNLFRFGPAPDFQDPNTQIAFAGAGGIGLPDRDYYLRDDVDSKKLIEQYKTHIAKMFELAGNKADASKAMAERVFAFEKRLAGKMLPRVELRNPKNQYRLVTLAQANSETPNFKWDLYFKALGVKIEKFSMTQPDFFKEANAMMADTNVSIWREYLQWGLLRSSAPFLSDAFAKENFDFYSRTLRGAKDMRPRWKRMVDTTSGLLGEPLGQLYVSKHFPPEAKAQAMELITDLKSALKVRLENLEWMSPETKKEALAKFATFTPKIGYPDRWRDYSKLKLKAGDFVGNIERIAAFENAFDLAKIGKPTDRSEWGMSPQTVNAYYNPLVNEIVFPAAILQPPFFDPKADKALNYGGIGGVIGHELLHGFDDQGSQFDAKGAQRNWWSAEDRKKFEERTAKLDKQASNTDVSGLKINGKLTMGENIADLGGITVAYDALQLALKRSPVAAIDGYTQDQRFYLSWANIWRRNMRPESLKLMINTDPHSPSVFRTNGPLSNIPTFHQAFACKPGDAMVHPDRVVIW